MTTRKTPFVNGQYYHIYNRGVDKRNIFIDQNDVHRFFQSMKEFNNIEPIGSLYEKSFDKKLGGSTAKPLVDFIAYCLNPNHYHFILRQITKNGISEFMKRIGGYTWYFNNKYNRNGALFQGRFKSIHIDSNEYLLHLSAYVNLNYKVHQLGGSTAKTAKSTVKSSWDEYINNKNNFCKKDIILNQFNSPSEYRKFTESSLKDILERKEMEKLLLE